MWEFFKTEIMPVVYVIGLVIIFYYQRSKIGNLKEDFERALGLLSVYDPDKFKSYVSILEERSEAIYEKHMERAKAEFDAVLAEAEVNTVRFMKESFYLLFVLIVPLADTRYLESSIKQLPNGLVKDSAAKLQREIGKINRQVGITGARIGINIDASPEFAKLLELQAKVSRHLV
jgi:hypothetical protein